MKKAGWGDKHVSYIWGDTGSKWRGVTILSLPIQERKCIVQKFMLGWSVCLYRRKMVPDIGCNHFVRQRIHRLLFMSLNLFYLESIFIVCVCSVCVWLCVYGACVCVCSFSFLKNYYFRISKKKKGFISIKFVWKEPSVSIFFLDKRMVSSSKLWKLASLWQFLLSPGNKRGRASFGPNSSLSNKHPNGADQFCHLSANKTLTLKEQ